jgi:phosphatidylserine/phosphatidylglycerophosphate/cardiolipin synthase-like enzyme
MRRLLLFVILILPGLACAIQITEFCPDPYLPEDPDEYLVIEGNGRLDGIIISDGEGGFRFPGGSEITGRITIARNGKEYSRIHGHLPDFEWYDTSPEVPDVIRTGSLQLSNTRDQLRIYQDNLLVQEIVWPDDIVTRQGQIHYLEDGIWDKRPLMIGQSRLVKEVFTDISGSAFVSPDSSYEVYKDFVQSTEHTLLVNVYEFSSLTMADDLIEAEKRGVGITVLLEGGPVGGVSDEEKTVISSLREAGIPVYFVSGSSTSPAPYRFDHAKYIVADSERVMLTSENFKPAGFPERGMRGNRGWGVVIEDPRVADYFTEVFHYDCGGDWVTPATCGADKAGEQLSGKSYQWEFGTLPFTGASVVPVLAPDTSYLIEEMISGAEKSIDIEQAYITNQSKESLNPYMQAAVDASRRGVRVRVLLDSSFFNIDEDSDNDEMVRVLNQLAREEQLPLEARCANLRANNLEKIHTKGVIVDRNSVLVSSINWNTNSPQFNREAGVIIIHPEVAGYFSSVFEDDWMSSDMMTGRKNPDVMKIGIATVIVLLLLLYHLSRRRRYY